MVQPTMGGVLGSGAHPHEARQLLGYSPSNGLLGPAGAGLGAHAWAWPGGAEDPGSFCSGAGGRNGVDGSTRPSLMGGSHWALWDAGGGLCTPLDFALQSVRAWLNSSPAAFKSGWDEVVP